MSLGSTFSDEKKENIEDIVTSICKDVNLLALPQVVARYKIISTSEIERINSRQDFLNLLWTNLTNNTFQPDSDSNEIHTLRNTQNEAHTQINSIIQSFSLIQTEFESIAKSIQHELPRGLQELQLKVAAKQYELQARNSQAYLLTVGESNSGKTTLCNCLLQKRSSIVPSSVINNHTKPICEFVSDVNAADNPTISAGQIHFDDQHAAIRWTSQNEPWSFEKAKQIVESDEYQIARFKLKSPLLDAGIILADTPGLSQSEAQEQLIKEWSVNALGYIVVINGGSVGLTSSIKDLLNKTQQSIPISKLFFVITHMDMIANDDERATQKRHLLNDLTTSFPGVNLNYIAFVDLQSNWLLWSDYGRFKSDYNEFMKQFCEYAVDLFQQLAVEAFQLATEALRALMDYSQIQVNLQTQNYQDHAASLHTLKQFQNKFSNDREKLLNSLYNIAQARSNLLSILIDQWLSNPATAIEIQERIANIRFSIDEVNNKQVRNDKLNAELLSIANELYSKFIATHIQDIRDAIFNSLCTHVSELMRLVDAMRAELQLPSNNLFLLEREVHKLIDQSVMKSSSIERLAPQHRLLLNTIGVDITFRSSSFSIVSAAKMIISIPQEIYNYYFGDSRSSAQQFTFELLGQLTRNKPKILKATTKLWRAEISDLVPLALSHLTSQMETVTSSLNVKLETSDAHFWESHLQILMNVEREISQSVNPIFNPKSSPSTDSWKQSHNVDPIVY